MPQCTDLAILDDLETFLPWLQSASGRERADVLNCLQREHRQVGSNVRAELDQLQIPYYQWTPELQEFYAGTSAFLFETLVWNRSPFKQAMRAWIAEQLPKKPGLRILCFGDGLGFDSLFLAQLGHDVTYFEVSRRAIAFAETMWQDAAQSITPLRDFSAFEQYRADHAASFDVVLVLDVLEHLPEPVSCVEQLATLLKDGGLMFVSAPFWLQTPAVATHLRSNRQYCGDLRRLYTPYHLRPLDAGLLWSPLLLQKTIAGKGRQRTWGAAWRIAFSGYLLWWARWWNTPHIWCVNQLFAHRAEPWEALEQACKSE